MGVSHKLPPGAKWITLPTSGERRVQLVVDIGADPATGKRRQVMRRFASAKDAQDFYAKTHNDVDRGVHVASSSDTLAIVAAQWLAGMRNIKKSTRSGYRYALAPVLQMYGEQPVQKLSKAQLDALVEQLVAGTLPLPAAKKGKTRLRRPWCGRTVGLTLFVLGQVLDDLIAQGRLVRNVADLVERPRHRPTKGETWTDDEADTFLAHVADDRQFVAWTLALYGLRRGEICGLRWEHVDLDAKKLSVGELTRIVVDGVIIEDDGKSEASHRELPMTRALVVAMRELRKQQLVERLAIGPAYVDSGFVLVDAAGGACDPEAMRRRFDVLGRAAGVPRIRLHDARHTCATLMNNAGEPMSVIAAWLGHASAAFTQRTYVHAQNPAMLNAANTLDAIYGTDKSTIRGSK